MNTHHSKPVEVSILDTKETIVNLIKNNRLGVTINRMILQEILTSLQIEEEIIVGRMRRELEEEQKVKEQTPMPVEGEKQDTKQEKEQENA